MYQRPLSLSVSNFTRPIYWRWPYVLIYNSFVYMSCALDQYLHTAHKHTSIHRHMHTNRIHVRARLEWYACIHHFSASQIRIELLLYLSHICFAVYQFSFLEISCIISNNFYWIFGIFVQLNESEKQNETITTNISNANREIGKESSFYSITFQCYDCLKIISIFFSVCGE